MKTLSKKTCLLFMCAAFVIAATAFAIAGSFSLSAAADASVPLGAVTVTADMKSGDVTLTDSFTFGQPVAAQIAQSPKAFTIAGEGNDTRSDLTLGKDYSFADNTITLKKRLVESLGEGIYWLNFDANGDYEYVLDVRGEGNWVLNEKKGSKTANGNDTVLTLNGWTGNYNTDGRAHYALPMDVSKPIYIPLSSLDCRTSGANWIMLALDENPYAAEYISETDKTPGIVKVLDMAASDKTGEGERMQGFAGFLQQTGVLHFSEIKNAVNADLFEIYIGETAADSYLKINGRNIGFGETTVKRSDFAGGVAYLDIYASNDVTFSVPSDLSAPFAYFDDTLAEQTYALKTEQDLKFYVTEVGDDFAVSYGGAALTADTDYTVEDNLVTVKGTYLKNLAYASPLVLTVASGAHKSDVKFATEVSGESSAKLASGESSVKFFEGSDLEFALDLGGETYLGLINVASGERMTQAVCEGGKLTVPAAQLSALDRGTYNFLIETNAGLIPAVIVCENFEHGAFDVSGSSDYSLDCGSVKVNEASEIIFDTIFDLDGKLELKLDIDAHGGYFLNDNSQGDKNSYIQMDFRDVFGGNTLTVRVRANTEESSTSRYKTWVDFTLTDADGKAAGTATRIFSREVTKGTHSITVAHTETGFTLTFDEDTPVSISDTATAADKMQFTLTSTENYKFALRLADVDYSALESAVAGAKTKSGAAYEAAAHLRFGATQAETDAAKAALSSSEEGCGCGSMSEADMLYAGIAALALASIAVLITFTRKSNAKNSPKK